MNRRSLIRGAAAMSAASYMRVLGANDRVQLGLVGCGERGEYVMTVFQNSKQVDVTAVCDVYGAKIDKVQQKAVGAKGFNDHRKLLETKTIDAVLIATPDHWHAMCAIDALNAGKDVYVEKPLTLTIEEGPPIVKAARVNNRICQVGMQQRSGENYLQAKREYIDSGKLGKITMARTWWHGNTYHLRKAPASLQTRPSNLDWARFLGPVKWRDYDPQQYFNFRAYLDFGGGQVTDLFTHWIDVVHLFMGQDNPIAAGAAGGVFHYKDGRTAPDTINVLLEYPKEWVATFEATLAPGIKGAAVEMCGTEGKLYITRQGFEFLSAERNAQPVRVPYAKDQTIDHVQNFLDCCRSRKLPNADVQIGHRSAAASHLGNIAYVQKRRLNYNPDREEILPL
ncbi:MAG: Gfo/Idh/MocA family oxidoreductase [Acidobacteria bacterium]|nr:Gfo/Idh/MocA family oxidoreductase [Acidobacteriota bacterium]